MITRFSIFKFIFSVCLLNLLLAQDEDDLRGVSPSQDLYISFDQTSGNTNNLVTGAEYIFSLVGDIGSLKFKSKKPIVHMLCFTSTQTFTIKLNFYGNLIVLVKYFLLAMPTCLKKKNMILSKPFQGIL